jgi:CheY-like chemotaxis protein
MASKRALVVDDSQSARLSLKRSLEQHGLIVDLAESGEECLTFLEDQLVDVIFMDHVMPGMDGLEAVSAIKRNPRTATIPVMMYTTREGELYVGQARALGAIGVLPKEVQPGVLFEMLLKLGLIPERRENDPATTEEAANRLVGEDIHPEIPAHPSAGTPMEARVMRVLEDAHLELRSDIMRSHRNFAKDVAAEVLDKHRAELELRRAELEPTRQRPVTTLGLAVLFAMPALILLALYWQAGDERDTAQREVDRLGNIVQQQADTATAQRSSLQSSFSNERNRSQARFLGALQWAVNEGARVGFEELAFNNAREDQLSELLTHLASLGFRGAVRMESHLGEFCLVSNEAGIYQLAEPTLPVAACALIGHPLDNSPFVSERQSVDFAEFLIGSPLVTQTGIDVQIIAHDRTDSLARHPYPTGNVSAGEWNRTAAMNHRIEFSVVSGSP